MSYFLKQREFMRAMRMYTEHTPGYSSDWEQTTMSLNLIDEEYEELRDAFSDYSESLDSHWTELHIVAAASVLDACVDLVYVVCQFANSLNLPFDEAFEEVHRSNMAKRGPDGKVTYREDGKVLKPPGWTPPNLLLVLEQAQKAHRARKLNPTV